MTVAVLGATTYMGTIFRPKYQQEQWVDGQRGKRCGFLRHLWRNCPHTNYLVSVHIFGSLSFFLSFLYLDSCHQVELGQPSSSRTFVLDIHFITRATRLSALLLLKQRLAMLWALAGAYRQIFQSPTVGAVTFQFHHSATSVLIFCLGALSWSPVLEPLAPTSDAWT